MPGKANHGVRELTTFMLQCQQLFEGSRDGCGREPLCRLIPSMWEYADRPCRRKAGYQDGSSGRRVERMNEYGRRLLFTGSEQHKID